MKRNVKIIIFIALILLVVAGLIYFSNNKNPDVVGGDRDAHGCLIGGGYAYSDYVGACIRSFELTSDIMKAAKLAVDSVGKSYALTVVAFNSYEEAGAYDIIFERGIERTKQTVYIKNWQVQK